jgi:hypothetical protein
VYNGAKKPLLRLEQWMRSSVVEKESGDTNVLGVGRKTLTRFGIFIQIFHESGLATARFAADPVNSLALSQPVHKFEVRILVYPAESLCMSFGDILVSFIHFREP